MNDLIERYVHQVGLYVRPKERAEIEAELRSQIHDQIQDRFGETHSQADIVIALKQLGDPRTMAASYSGEQHLVGPRLYTFMMTVLRFGLPLVPAVVVIANVVGAALSPQGANWVGLLLGSIFTAAQATLLFFAVVVLIFALLERSSEEIRANALTEFNPLELPAVDDPRDVDRVESSVGIALGTLFGFALLYYLQVGGLTLRFNLSDPGDVLPVPTGWLVVLLFTTVCSVFLNLLGLIRRRWSLGSWLAQIAVDLLGVVGFYYVVLLPLLGRATQAVPTLGDPQSLNNLAWLITLFTIVLIVMVSGVRLIRLWQYRQTSAS